MSRATLLRQRLLALFLVAAFAYFSPLPKGVESASAVLGVPALYLYLFGVWALVVAAAAWVGARRRD